MSVTTMELYEALIAAGVGEEKAKAAAKAVISREEAQGLATKGDVSDLKVDLYKFLFAAMVTQTVFIVGDLPPA